MLLTKPSRRMPANVIYPSCEIGKRYSTGTLYNKLVKEEGKMDRTLPEIIF